MKQFNYFLILLTLAISAVSCDSDENEPVQTSATFTATIDGEEFTATNAFAYVSEMGRMIIAGIDESTGELIILDCAAMEGVSTQEIWMTYKQHTNGPLFYNDSDDATQLPFNLTVTSLQSTLVSGHFSFTGFNFSHGLSPKSITGNFSNVPIQDSFPFGLMEWPQSTASTITASVNGLAHFFEYAVTENVAGIKTIRATTHPTLRFIEISLPEDISTGTYELGTPEAAGITAKYGHYGVEATAAIGTFTILDNSDVGINAEFSFTGTDGQGDSYVVSQGYMHLAN